MSQLNSKSSNVMFEALESRSMMSAAPIHAAAPVHQPVVHATVVKQTPALANPAVTDSSMTYTSFASDPLFSTAGPNANDINQGYIGDCYFLSTLASVAKTDPALIKKDVASNGNGTYTVKFTGAHGVQSIVVDAQFPTWSNGQLAYAGLGAQHCTWVAVMEKAWAEFRTTTKSYASIDGGWMSQAFSALGVASETVVNIANGNALLTLINTRLKAKFAGTFATNGAILDNAPLVADHAYEIDGVNVDAKGHVISLRLRNPWGVDGVGNDGHNDGYVTLTVQQAYDNLCGIVTAKV